MPETTERWTADRVRALPDDGNRHELIEGELVVTPAPGPAHQIVCAELFHRLNTHLRATGAGTVLWSPADLSFGEDEILQPDLFVFPAGIGMPQSWADIESLLLAIEVLSPSTARYDRGLKRHRYQRAGIPEYWVVDIDAQLIERWRPDDARPEIVTDRLLWEPVPGAGPLEVDIPGLFRSIQETN